MMHQPTCICEKPLCPADVGDFYVSVRNDDGDARFLLGPYATHEEALANVDRGQKLAWDYGDPRAAWYAYGTARADAGTPIKTIFGR